MVNNGIVKIADFGLAKEIEDKTSTIIGTKDIIAPEIINNQKYDFAADVWSLGIIFYYLLENEFPINIENLNF